MHPGLASPRLDVEVRLGLHVGQVDRRVQLGLAQGLAADDLAWVEPAEENGGGGHHQAVEDVEVGLLHLQLAGGAAGVLGDTVDVPDQDDGAAGVEDEEQLLPGLVGAGGLSGGVGADAEVEENADDNEEDEEDDLDSETGENDVVSEIHLGLRLGGHENAGTAALDQERDDIAGDEDFGEPLGLDHGEVLAVQEDDDAPEYHVDGGGEQVGPEQEEGGLQDVWVCRKVGCLVRGDYTTNVANSLDCMPRCELAKAVERGGGRPCVGLYLQRQPTMNGMKYHVRRVASKKVW